MEMRPERQHSGNDRRLSEMNMKGGKGGCEEKGGWRERGRRGVTSALCVGERGGETVGM